MLKVGVLGAGHLGKIHLRLLKQSNNIYGKISVLIYINSHPLGGCGF